MAGALSSLSRCVYVPKCVSKGILLDWKDYMLSHPEWQESPEGLWRSSSKRKHWKLAVVVQAENIRCTKRCLYLSVNEGEERSSKYKGVRGGGAREMVYD